MSEAPARRRLSTVVTALLWLLAAVAILNIPRHLELYLWDFKVYYHAGQAFAGGENPYDVATLHRYAVGTPQSAATAFLPFVYPSLTLYACRALCLLPITAAAWLWFFLKLGCLAGLLFLWDRYFVPLRRSPLVPLLLLLAFDRALYTDLVSGNVSLIEELLIWLGLCGLLRGRALGGGLCIALAAQIKLAPVLFLLVWLLIPPRPRWTPFLISGAVFAALFSLNAVLHPALFRQFLSASRGVDDRGVNNPCLLAFLRDVQDRLVSHGFGVPHGVVAGVFLVVVLSVITASAVAWRRACRRGDPSPMLLVLFFCLVYALCLPRFSAYTYVLLLVPALFTLRSEPRRWVQVGLGVLLLLPALLTLLAKAPVLRVLTLPFSHVPSLALDYLPLWSAFLVWGLLLRRLRVPVRVK